MVGGAGFHLVNTGLSLLRMLREYVAFQDAVPAFASDTARRVVAMLQVPACSCSASISLDPSQRDRQPSNTRLGTSASLRHSPHVAC